MQKYALKELRSAGDTFELPCAVQLIKHDAARQGYSPNISFSAATFSGCQQVDITEVKNPTASQWSFVCDMPALSGSQGVMPRYYYTESIKALFDGNSALIDFFNGFNNRYYRLYCKSELKNNLSAQAEEEHFQWNQHDQSLTKMLSNLYGDLGNNPHLPAAHMIQYSAMLGLKLTCPHTLKDLLIDYFEYDFEVDVGDVIYQPLLPSSLSRLGKSGMNNQLGVDLVLGKSAVMPMPFQRLNIMIEPNDSKQLNQIRSDKYLYNALNAFVRHYMGIDSDVKLMIKIAGKYLPGLHITSYPKNDIFLAQTTWLALKNVNTEFVVIPLKKLGEI